MAWQLEERLFYLLVVVLVRILNLQLRQLIAILVVAGDKKTIMESCKKMLPLLLLQLLKVPASLLLLLVNRLKAGKHSLQQAQNSLEHIHLNSIDIFRFLLF